MKFRIVEEYSPNEVELLYYDSLDITIYGEMIDTDYYNPPEWEEFKETVDYTLEKRQTEVVDALMDIVHEKDEKGKELVDAELEKYITGNYDEFLNKYYNDVLDYFEEEATEKAQKLYQNEYDYRG